MESFLFLACGFRSILCFIVFAVLLACVVVGEEVEVAAHLTWTRPPAIAAELAASHRCSGHGYIFTDTFTGPNQSHPVCECNDCFESATCARKKRNCPVDCLSLDPGFLEPFWIKNAKASSIVVPSWYRMSYEINDYSEGSLLTEELKYWIIRLHELAGNAVAKNKYIIPGLGSGHVYNAAIYSLSYSPSGEYMKNQSLIVASEPYFFAFRTQAEVFDSMRYRWGGDSKKYVGQTEGKKFIEVITNPNNPDAEPQKSILKGDVKVVSDRVAYWPHYTAMTETADDDLMLFSLSKLTGHAGTRFGWALVKDEDVYKRMYDYMENDVGLVPHDVLIRTTVLLKTIVEGYDKNIHSQKMFDIAYNELRWRWKKVSDLFSKTDRFTLQKTTPKFCNFFKKVVEPSEAFAWVTCNWDEDCAQVFLEAGIKAKTGTAFEGNLNQARIVLVKRKDNFEMLYGKLKSLIEASSSPIYPKITSEPTSYAEAI